MEQIIRNTGPPTTDRYGFLLLEDFTMMAFAAAIEPLRTANRHTESEL